nr:CoA-binding protein [Delftia lacustris]
MSLLQALNPRSVAILGASDNPIKAGGRPIDYLRRHGFAGRILPVNPKRAEVQGLAAYPRCARCPRRPTPWSSACPARTWPPPSTTACPWARAWP